MSAGFRFFSTVSAVSAAQLKSSEPQKRIRSGSETRPAPVVAPEYKRTPGRHVVVAGTRAKAAGRRASHVIISNDVLVICKTL